MACGEIDPPAISTVTSTSTPDYPATREARKNHAATWSADSTQFYLETVNAPTPTRTPILSATPTLTPTITLTPTLTITPTKVPPLVAHTWQPEHVLVKLQHSRGDSSFKAQSPPTLILYANGQLIISGQSRDFQFQPMTKVLSQSESCALLNTIDQVGFFDYDDSTYDPGIDNGVTQIQVDAWRSNISYNTVLPSMIYCTYDNCDLASPDLVILPAIRNTFLLLDNYYVEGLRPYKSDQLLVWLSPPWNESGVPWPLESISLADLLSLRNSEKNSLPVILEGSIISEWVENVPNGVYEEGELKLAVYSRPLWPYEYVKSGWTVDIPDPAIPPPDFTLSCSPEDGVLPILE